MSDCTKIGLLNESLQNFWIKFMNCSFQRFLKVGEESLTCDVFQIKKKHNNILHQGKILISSRIRHLLGVDIFQDASEVK